MALYRKEVRATNTAAAKELQAARLALRALVCAQLLLSPLEAREADGPEEVDVFSPSANNLHGK